MAQENDTPIFVDVTTGNTFTELLDDLSKINSSDPEKNDRTTQATENDSNEQAKKNCLLIQTRKIKCSECKTYSAENAEKMARHIRKAHRGENPFQCYMCEYGTYNKSLFEEHVRIHQGIKPFKCAFCPHRNVSKKNLKKHELIHRPDNPLKCPHCNHIAKHKRGFAYHAKTYHTKTEDATFICPKCNKNFVTLDTLNMHTNVQKKCDVCEFTACTKYLLNIHKETKHGIEKKIKKEKKCGRFKCALCQWTSNNRPRILLHLIHHPNQEVDENIVDITILKEHGIMN